MHCPELVLDVADILVDNYEKVGCHKRQVVSIQKVFECFVGNCLVDGRDELVVVTKQNAVGQMMCWLHSTVVVVGDWVLMETGRTKE